MSDPAAAELSASEHSDSAQRRRAPASVGQGALWIIDQLTGTSADYVMVLAFGLSGPADEAALAAAVDDVVARHSALRTRFVEQDGLPVQEVVGDMRIPLLLEELDGGETALDDRLRREASREFDLATDPLFVPLLLKSGRDQVLVLTVHHIIFDGHSLDVLMEDLGASYLAHRDRRAVPLPPTSQFTEFAATERDWISGPDGDEQLNFWRSTLAGAASLNLAPDRPRHQDTPSTAGEVRRTFSPEVVGAVGDLLTRERMTPFMLMHAVYHLALAQATGRRDTAAVTPVANRPDDMQDAVGYFVNMVAVRINSEHCRTFRDLLLEVRGVWLDAYEHQDYPFARVIAALPPEPGQSRPDLQNALLFEYSADRAAVEWDDLTLTPLIPQAQTSKFDLTASIVWGQDEGLLELEYRSALFEQRTIVGLADTVVDVLERVAANPDVAITELIDPAAAEAHEPGASVQASSTTTVVDRTARNAREEVIAALFAEVLDLDSVRVTDSFFNLGGHSLLAGRLSSRIRATLGVDLTVPVIFQSPTAAELATHLENDLPDPLAALMPLRESGSKAPVVFLPAIGGLGWSYARFLPFIPKRHPVFTLQATHWLGTSPPPSLTDVASEYLRLIRTLPTYDELSLVGWSLGGVLAHDVAVQFRESGGTVQSLVLLDALPVGADTWTERETRSEEMEIVIEESVQIAGGSGAAELSSSTLADLDRIAHQMLPLLITHRSRPYDGHTVSIEAESSRIRRERNSIQWSDVSGTSEVHSLSCAHNQLMEPETVRITGPILAAAISKARL